MASPASPPRSWHQWQPSLTRRKIKLRTINVIEVESSGWDEITINRIASFTDNKVGNKKAEALFVKWIKAAYDGEHIDKEDLEDAIMEGHYEITNGHIYLVRSN